MKRELHTKLTQPSENQEILIKLTMIIFRNNQIAGKTTRGKVLFLKGKYMIIYLPSLQTLYQALNFVSKLFKIL